VHVGVHKVHYLHDSLSHDWVSESCPSVSAVRRPDTYREST
jgi:hypothetical protein